LNTLVHPASLNPFQQYRQACSLLRGTSRARLPAWYQNALELDFQIHIRHDGATDRAYFYNRSKDEWSEAPLISEATLSDDDAASAYALQILKHVRSLKGTSLGVVLHIADEFATAELNPDLDNPADLKDLRETAFNNPEEILDDSSVPADQASWRVLPYPAAGSDVIGTTISLSRRLEHFVAAIRKVGDEKNFPIITHTLSAPLVSMSGLHSVIRKDSGKPAVAILQYPWFTVIAFFNEHLDLRLVRTLQHRGTPRPLNFRHALSTTNASLEFLEPDFYVVPLAEKVDLKIPEDLKRTFPDSHVQTVSFPVPASVPEWAPEVILSLEPAPQETEPLSHTFGALRDEKWFLQDFLPPGKEEIELFPSRNEMRILRLFKLGRVALFAAAILCIGWFALSVYSMTSKVEWKFNPEDGKAVQQRLVKLTLERQRLDHWNSLLEDRSKAWTSMETLARLFPAESDILVKSFNHTVKPDNTRGQAKIAFVKEWMITGFVREDGLDYLNTMNSREGISKQFAEISKATGNLAFDPSPTTRTLVINVKTQENSSFRQMLAEDMVDSDESTYPYKFNLTITQRFESTDPFAAPAGKAP